MSILDIGKVVLFSEMNGQLLMKGEPVKNARIRRVANFSKDITDYATTDENGDFYFPAASVRTITTFLPTEFTARQELWVEVDGVEERFWLGVKSQREANSEARGDALKPVCELSNQNEMFRVRGAVFDTKCDWGVEKDKRRNIFGQDAPK